MIPKRGEDRKHEFKKVDLDSGRRRREETTTQLRKAKKEEQLMKRRQAPQPMATNVEERQVVTNADIPSLMGVFQNPTSTPEMHLSALQGFRRMLSVDKDPPAEEVIAAGAVPFFVKLLQCENSTMVFEAAWTLTNIASTEKTQVVVDEGALPILIQLLRHGDPNIREQAAWCIGNIAGDKREFRDLVLAGGALEGLILNLNEPETSTLLGNVTWAVSNLCRGKPAPKEETIKAALVPLATLFARNVADDPKIDALWALSYLSDGDNSRIQMVLDTGVIPRLIKLAQSEDTSNAMTVPLVRTLGNCVTGSDEQTQLLVDAGVLDAVKGLLGHAARSIRKETCWLLSNIAAGTEEQITMLMKNRKTLEKVVDMSLSEHFEVRKEALWVIANIFTTGTDHHVRALVNLKGLEALALALANIPDSKILIAVMEAIEKVMEVGAKANINYTLAFDEAHGIENLEHLQQHESLEVYEKAVEIIELYFGSEDDEDENIAPTQENGMFSFGINESAKQLFPEPECAVDPDSCYSSVLGTSKFDWNADSEMNY